MIIPIRVKVINNPNKEGITKNIFEYILIIGISKQQNWKKTEKIAKIPAIINNLLSKKFHNFESINNQINITPAPKQEINN